jgi:hypothetical protein
MSSSPSSSALPRNNYGSSSSGGGAGGGSSLFRQGKGPFLSVDTGNRRVQEENDEDNEDDNNRYEYGDDDDNIEDGNNGEEEDDDDDDVDVYCVDEDDDDLAESADVDNERTVDKRSGGIGGGGGGGGVIDIFGRRDGVNPNAATNNAVFVPPPLPLLKFDSYMDRDWTKIAVFDGNQIPTIHNSFPSSDGGTANHLTDYSDCNRLHNPIVCKLLAKWYSCRAKREQMFKQRSLSDYNQQILMQQGQFVQPTANEVECLDSLNEGFQLLDVPIYKHSWKMKQQSAEQRLQHLLLPKLDNNSDGSNITVNGGTSAGSSMLFDKTDNLIFDSNFESGNLQTAHRIFNRETLMSYRPYEMSPSCSNHYIVPHEVDQEYDLVLRNDLFTDGNTQWYYFAVDPKNYFSRKSANSTPVASNSAPLRVRFNIVNMKKNDSLYNYGMKPCISVISSSGSGGRSVKASPRRTHINGDDPGDAQKAEGTDGANKFPSGMPQWQHGGYDICYYKNYIRVHPLSDILGKKKKKSSKDKEKEAKKGNGKIRYQYSLSFSYTFASSDVVYFAHSFPYTYTDLERYMSQLESSERISSIMHRRLLAWTLAGNRCDLLTITSRQNQPVVDGGNNNNGSSNGASNSVTPPPRVTPPPQSASQPPAPKPVIVLTSRVHPGESQASYIMQGIIDFLTADTPVAQLLRENYVFKIVPMLNVDGVIHGNYRCSLSGVDLNRRYREPIQTFHPTIHALKDLINTMQSERPVLLFIDIHGHSKHKNAFTYGCDILQQSAKRTAAATEGIHADDILHRRVYSRVFPRILCSLKRPPTPWSTDSNQDNEGYFNYLDCKYRISRSKYGTGRVVSWESLNVEGSYTIEASFCANGNNKESKLLKAYLDDPDNNFINMINNLVSLNDKMRIKKNNGEKGNSSGLTWSGSPAPTSSSYSDLPALASPRSLGFYSPIASSPGTSPIPIPSINSYSNLTTAAGGTNTLLRCRSVPTVVAAVSSATLPGTTGAPVPQRAQSVSPATAMLGGAVLMPTGSPGIAFRPSKKMEAGGANSWEFADASRPSTANTVATTSISSESGVPSPRQRAFPSFGYPSSSSPQHPMLPFMQDNSHPNENVNEVSDTDCPLKNLLDSYATTWHYTKQDYHMMGQHICTAIAGFLNVHVAASTVTAEDLAAEMESMGLMIPQENEQPPQSQVGTQTANSSGNSGCSGVSTTSSRNPWSAPVSVTAEEVLNIDEPVAATDTDTAAPIAQGPSVESRKKFPLLAWRDLLLPIKCMGVHSTVMVDHVDQIREAVLLSLSNAAPRSSSQQLLAWMANGSDGFKTRMEHEVEIRQQLLAEAARAAGNNVNKQIKNSCQDLADYDSDYHNVDGADDGCRLNFLLRRAEMGANEDKSDGSDSEPSVDNVMGSRLTSGGCADGRAWLSLLRRVDGSAAKYHKQLRVKDKKKKKKTNEDFFKMNLNIAKLKSDTSTSRRTLVDTANVDVKGLNTAMPVIKTLQSQSLKQASQQIPTSSVPANKQAYEFRERSASVKDSNSVKELVVSPCNMLPSGTRSRNHSLSKASAAAPMTSNIEIESVSHLLDSRLKSQQAQQLQYPQSLQPLYHSQQQYENQHKPQAQAQRESQHATQQPISQPTSQQQQQQQQLELYYRTILANGNSSSNTYMNTPSSPSNKAPGAGSASPKQRAGSGDGDNLAIDGGIAPIGRPVSAQPGNAHTKRLNVPYAGNEPTHGTDNSSGAGVHFYYSTTNSSTALNRPASSAASGRIVVNRAGGSNSNHHQPSAWFSQPNYHDGSFAGDHMTTRPQQHQQLQPQQQSHSRQRHNSTSSAAGLGLVRTPSGNSLLTSSIFEANIQLAKSDDNDAAVGQTTSSRNLHATHTGTNINTNLSHSNMSKQLQANKSLRSTAMVNNNTATAAVSVSPSAQATESLVTLLDTLSIRKIAKPSANRKASYYN